MQNFSASPAEMVRSLWRNRSLIRSLVTREVVGRYRGSFMGILWSFFNPVFMLLVYTFVFSVVFKAKWGGSSVMNSDSKTEFALVLFAGLIIFNLFAECFNRAPSLILANVNYVKKVVFPLEILSWVALGSALFHAAISLSVWLAAYLIFMGLPQITLLWLPFVFLPLVLFIMGLSWALAALGVYLRDVSQLTGMATTTLMFISPIFYPASALPEKYRKVLYLNPITPAIEMARDVLYWGKAPNLIMLTVYTVTAAVLAWLGFAWFQKTRKGFADVI